MWYNQAMQPLPKNVQKFLWSADLAKLDLDKSKTRIILNVLNLGDWAATGWLFSQYSRPDIIDAVINYGAKELSPKSLNYWRLLLNIREKDLIVTRF